MIITGAAKGIGRACAEVFAREGARLVLNDVDERGLEQAAASLGDGAEVATVVGDVSVEEDARRIVATGVESFGGVDSLVANAGIIPLSGIEQARAEEWDQVMAVDGRGRPGRRTRWEGWASPARWQRQSASWPPTPHLS